jgi:hypothetical protein
VGLRPAGAFLPRAGRKKGAPIGIAPDPRTAHECGDSRYLAIPFIDACLAMRLPDKGSRDQTLKPVDMSQAWLVAFPGDAAQPAAAFRGNPNAAVWLPNEAVAKAWVDASAKSGEKHTYAVIEVNSVGLTSKPSAATSSR